ncbi:ABC transporter ATP-binding protein [Variovorax sp. E3]|uniref:ABC transporter ATP-binding protein n=1 Tax=Variovorax sp. E3 TaxID=1914993 RepID=UPI0018DC9951|nr:ABC transporter ATP-binding protein [Variovorax sp. E3]
MASLNLSGVHKSYGSTAALAPTDFDVPHGEFVTLLGPSGCGKTTLLRIVAGIASASGGEIRLGGRRIDTLPPEQRDVAMVFQTYALFPHMSVRKNLGFGLRMKKIAPAEQARRIAHAVAICKLDGLLDRMPRQLSGGQQQRVALARAIVMQPALLLFDEPLSNLDAKLRESLREELVALHRRVGTTSLYVTHDQAEAMAMSDRILVMNAGRIVESGTPLALYRRPVDAFTAQFLGHTHLLRLPLTGRGKDCRVTLPWGASAAIDELADGAYSVDGAGSALVSLRPEGLSVVPDADGAGEVTAASFTGAQVNYTVRIADLSLRVTVTAGDGTRLLPVGQRVNVTVGERLHALKSTGQDPGHEGRA